MNIVMRQGWMALGVSIVAMIGEYLFNSILSPCCRRLDIVGNGIRTVALICLILVFLPFF
jgi:hypothetical protein